MDHRSRRSLRSATSLVLAFVVAGCWSTSPTPSPSVTATPGTPTATPAGSPASPPPTAPEPTDPPSGTALWTPVTPSGGGPAPRAGHTWTADPSSGVAYLFGGTGSAGALDDLWAFDVAADAWTEISAPGARPSARSGHAAAWIDGLGVVIVGGEAGATALDDAWIFDPSAGAWRPLETDGPTPSPRAGACAVADPSLRLWLSHGRSGEATDLADTWVYDSGSATWAAQPVSGTVPGPRSGAACWWTDDGRFGLFGGRTSTGDALGDQWSFAGDDPAAGWVAGPGIAGAARADAAATRSATVLLAIGGRGPDGELLGDLVALDPTAMSGGVVASSGEAPEPREAASIIDDPAGERRLLFGGRGTGGLLGDLWSLDRP